MTGILQRSLIVWCVFALLLGCGAEDEGGNQDGDNVPRQGSIRVVNAIADAPDLVSSIGGDTFGTTAFGNATALTKENVGRYDVDIGYTDTEGDAVLILDDELLAIKEALRKTENRADLAGLPIKSEVRTTLERLRISHHNGFRQYEPGLIGIGTTPKFAIGQRALLLCTPEGNILWDCISLIDDATVLPRGQKAPFYYLVARIIDGIF